MKWIMLITLRGIVRDRVLHGILATSALFLLIPSVSSLSMRQVTELSITLCVSFISFLLLILAVFLGGTAVWKDIERRYTFSILGLPISRSRYLCGKFFGIAIFILAVAILLGMAASVVIWFSSGIYQSDRPIAWSNIFLCIAFDSLKYIFLVAFAVLFSTLSTSFFLPIFGTVSIFLVGNATQEAYDFIHTPTGQALSPLVRKTGAVLYYLLPNFTAFDLKVNAIYGVPFSMKGILLTLAYFAIYVGILLCLSTSIFNRRELK